MKVEGFDLNGCLGEPARMSVIPILSANPSFCFSVISNNPIKKQKKDQF